MAAIETRYCEELRTNKQKNQKLAVQLRYLETQNVVQPTELMQKKDRELAALREELDEIEYVERGHRDQLQNIKKGQIKLKKQLNLVQNELGKQLFEAKKEIDDLKLKAKQKV